MHYLAHMVICIVQVEFIRGSGFKSSSQALGQISLADCRIKGQAGIVRLGAKVSVHWICLCLMIASVCCVDACNVSGPLLCNCPEFVLVYNDLLRYAVLAVLDIAGPALLKQLKTFGLMSADSHQPTKTQCCQPNENKHVCIIRRLLAKNISADFLNYLLVPSLHWSSSYNKIISKVCPGLRNHREMEMTF